MNTRENGVIGDTIAVAPPENMDSARSFGRSAAKTVVVLWLLSVLTFASTPSKTTRRTSSSKKSTASAAARRTTGKSSRTVASASHRSRSSNANDDSSNGTRRGNSRKVVVSRRLVHGRWVRTTQIVHVASGPSYQTHPEPERYEQIQQALATSGYFKGQVNGQWGDDSVAALKQFQSDHKLVNDGKISSLSLIGLGLGPNRELAAKPAEAPTASLPPAPVPAPNPAAQQ